MQYKGNVPLAVIPINIIVDPAPDLWKRLTKEQLAEAARIRVQYDKDIAAAQKIVAEASVRYSSQMGKIMANIPGAKSVG